jgi:hypothetical protein
MACGHFLDSAFVSGGKRRGFCRLRPCPLRSIIARHAEPNAPPSLTNAAPPNNRMVPRFRCRKTKRRARVSALDVTVARKKFALVLNFHREVLHRARVWPNIRAALRGVVPLVTSRNGGPDPLEVWHPK